jgi:transcriptional regulator with XRE-family HTH domain
VTKREQEIANAIRELRKVLNESQQQFSDRLGVTVRTIARYELEAPPHKRAVLAKLGKLAAKAGRPDLSRVFFEAEPNLAAEAADRAFAAIAEEMETQAALILFLRGALGPRFKDDLDAFLTDSMAKFLKEANIKAYKSPKDAIAHFIQEIGSDPTWQERAQRVKL